MILRLSYKHMRNVSPRNDPPPATPRQAAGAPAHGILLESPQHTIFPASPCASLHSTCDLNWQNFTFCQKTTHLRPESISMSKWHRWCCRHEENREPSLLQCLWSISSIRINEKCWMKQSKVKVAFFFTFYLFYLFRKPCRHYSPIHVHLCLCPQMRHWLS